MLRDNYIIETRFAHCLIRQMMALGDSLTAGLFGSIKYFYLLLVFFNESLLNARYLSTDTDTI